MMFCDFGTRLSRSPWALILLLFSWIQLGRTIETDLQLDDLQIRVLNGTKARHGQFPFMVSILINGEHFCGGSLLNAEWVLSAAHCVPQDTSKLSIFAGFPTLSYRSTKGNIVNVSQVISHPQYVAKDNYANDIALLKLASPIEKTRYIQYVKLPPANSVVPANTFTLVVGWGITKTREYFASDNLLYAQIITIRTEKCQELYTDIHLEPTQLCAGLSEGGMGQCSGDSGGPLVLDDYQIGIVSWSQKPCASKDHPGVFTRVSSYIPWIVEVVKQHSTH